MDDIKVGQIRQDMTLADKPLYFIREVIGDAVYIEFLRTPHNQGGSSNIIFYKNALLHEPVVGYLTTLERIIYSVPLD